MSTFGYRKRMFLASISTGHTSYILTEVESSRGGENKWGHCMLTMADCRRRIQLEYFSALFAHGVKASGRLIY